MSRAVRWWSSLFCLSVVAVPVGLAQTKPPVEEPGVRLQPTRDYGSAPYKAFREMVMSPAETPVDEPKHQEVIDTAAQYFAYRLTWTELQTVPNGMSKLVNDIDLTLQDFPAFARKGANNEEVRKRFSELLVTRLKEVLANPRLIARINAARALAHVAETGYEEVADVLVELLEDSKQNDAVKYWAIHGLWELFKLAHLPEPVLIRKKEREAAAIQALLKSLNHPVSASASKEEQEGARLFRREVLRALALTRYPALLDEKGKKVVARPAQALLQVVARPDNFKPSLRLDEQVEAAVGLARMQAKLAPDYQPDYGAEHIGRFVVRLAEQYDKEGKKGMEAWKIHAARLGEALEMMKIDALKNAKDKKAGEYVNDVLTRAAPVLTSIEKGTTASAANLANWLNSNPSKNATLFRGAADTAVKVAEPTEK